MVNTAVIEANLNRTIETMKPGDRYKTVRFNGTEIVPSDWSTKQTEASLLYRKFGAVMDTGLPDDDFILDWSAKTEKPTLRLGRKLFEHVDSSA